MTTPPRAQWPPLAAVGLLRLVVVCTCAGSAGAHAVLTLPHLGESLSLGVAFAVAAVALAAAALAVRDPRFDTWAPRASACLLAGTATAYVLSRTTGIPGLVPQPEPLDALGLATLVAELTAAVAALPLTPRKARP